MHILYQTASEINEGKTAPKKYNFAPDITRKGAENDPINSANNSDNLIAFCFCSLLCVLYVLPALGRYTNKSIHIILNYKKTKK